MMIANIIIHFVVGMIGGNATCECASSASRFSLGGLGNTITGGLGGIGGAQLFAMLVPIDMSATGAEIQMMIGQIAAAALCGIALTCAVGYLRKMVFGHRHAPSHHISQI
jgi:hypothetical protein